MSMIHNFSLFQNNVIPKKILNNVLFDVVIFCNAQKIIKDKVTKVQNH